ncbi:CidA/LrgA family protein [Bacillus sp. USDA818B3_A]|uniref:CidA/LrgA family protein n=1 Tax=Bacillus sp. USDA818B3_A TaxID=2698834 RepID=UPI00136B093F|nr:CidA/LrgA family protein [Bacillus sp. USDA818B3_A]
MKKTAKFFFQLAILIVIYQTGNLVTNYLHLQIPGNVIGIVILLLMLLSGLIKVEQIQLASEFLLKHLGFFFIPISVGLMTLGATFMKVGWILLLILFISAFIGIVIAGKTTQTVMARNHKENVNHHDHAL